MKKICKYFLKISGWKLEGQLPPVIHKYILAVYPHTTNWDFIIGLLVRGAMGFRARFLGKSSLFRPPFRFFFRALGGIPVDRSRSNHTVMKIAQMIKESDQFILAIAPEGTRKKVEQWKTGFYYIAFHAGVPVVFVHLDWKKKMVKFMEPFYPSGDFGKDEQEMKSFFTNN